MDADRGDNGNGEGGGRGGGRGRGGGLGGGLGTGGEEEREREGGEDGRDLQTVLQLIRSRQNQQSPQPPALPPPQTQLGSPTQFSLSQSLSLDDQQPGPSGLGRLQPVPGGLAQLQPVPAHFSQLQPVPGGLAQLQPVPAHFSQLQPVPGALNEPVVPQIQQYRNTGRSQAMDDGSTSSSQDTPTQQVWPLILSSPDSFLYSQLSFSLIPLKFPVIHSHGIFPSLCAATLTPQEDIPPVSYHSISRPFRYEYHPG